MNLCISKIAEEEIELLLKLLREKANWLIKIGKPNLNKLYRECGFTLKREIHVEDDLNACLYEHITPQSLC
uniref:hypothetical protein n=1 Tax=Lacrimispora sp. TaxID=2719234 RepID=UPI0032E45D1E